MDRLAFQRALLADGLAPRPAPCMAPPEGSLGPFLAAASVVERGVPGRLHFLRVACFERASEQLGGGTWASS